MAVLDNQFSEKYGLLPEEVRLYYLSELSGQAVLGLAAEYKLPDDFVYSLVFLMVNSDFDLTLLEEKIKASSLSGISAKRFEADFLGRLILPISPYLEEQSNGKINIETELKKRSVNPANYQNWVNDFDNLLDNENDKVMEEIVARYEKEVDPKQEHDYVIDFLSNNLIELLKADSPAASVCLNSGLIYLLFNSEGFKDEADKIILSSSELIGTRNIIIDGREVAPSVANWLKEFIKKNGTDLFNDIALAQYLDNSENVKKLSGYHREILSNLLRFYKNITFFPESMSNVLPDKWQIFPFSFPEEDLGSKKSVSAILEPPVVSPIITEPVTAAATNSIPVPTPTPNSSPTALEDKDLLGLKIALKKYPPVSLEYKAIMEEIRRLEK
jgi:hypothetical protein